MSSCEHNRKVPYSGDLRWRMVWQKFVLGHTYEQVALNLNVDKSIVWRTGNCLMKLEILPRKVIVILLVDRFES